jgi:hypothetical protein
MKVVKIASIILLCAMTSASAATAQSSPKPGAGATADAPPKHFYRLDYVLRESDSGKVINQRSFTNTGSSGPQMWKIRSGTRLPTLRNNEVNYIDVGVNIDSRLQEVGDTLALEVNADITSAADNGGTTAPPVLRQARANCETVISVGKPALLFAVDDPASKHRFELEVTAFREK